MRDWEFLKVQCGNQFYVGVEASLLKEAIAEIEQLRQEKAELVEAIKSFVDIDKSFSEYSIVHKSEVFQRLKRCVTKAEGGQQKKKCTLDGPCPFSEEL